MEFKSDFAGVYTSELWYDLMDGGYFGPEDFLVNEADIKTVNEALEIVRSFVNEAINIGAIEVE